jgi:hypothetical protein
MDFVSLLKLGSKSEISENSLQGVMRNLQKLQKESSKKHTALRKGCQDALGKVMLFSLKITVTLYMQF